MYSHIPELFNSGAKRCSFLWFSQVFLLQCQDGCSSFRESHADSNKKKHLTSETHYEDSSQSLRGLGVGSSASRTLPWWGQCWGSCLIHPWAACARRTFFSLIPVHSVAACYWMSPRTEWLLTLRGRRTPADTASRLTLSPRTSPGPGGRSS